MILDLPMFTLIHVVISVLAIIAGLVVVGPAHVVGALSLVVLAVCLAALYWKRLERGWRATYVIAAVAALCLNVFVLVVQLFAKTPALAQLAPTQQEPPFAVTPVIVLALFAWLGWATLRGFRIRKAGG